MRNRVALVAVCVLVAGSLAVAYGADAVAGNGEAVTFNEHIGPIIHNRCASCHRPGQAGPFSLLAYEDVAKRAPLIRAVTQSRYMPPWHAEPGYGSFVACSTRKWSVSRDGSIPERPKEHLRPRCLLSSLPTGLLARRTLWSKWRHPSRFLPTDLTSTGISRPGFPSLKTGGSGPLSSGRRHVRWFTTASSGRILRAGPGNSMPWTPSQAMAE